MPFLLVDAVIWRVQGSPHRWQVGAIRRGRVGSMLKVIVVRFEEVGKG